jgi:hypothetical protein
MVMQHINLRGGYLVLIAAWLGVVDGFGCARHEPRLGLGRWLNETIFNELVFTN